MGKQSEALIATPNESVVGQGTSEKKVNAMQAMERGIRNNKKSPVRVQSPKDTIK